MPRLSQRAKGRLQVEALESRKMLTTGLVAPLLHPVILAPHPASVTSNHSTVVQGASVEVGSAASAAQHTSRQVPDHAKVVRSDSAATVHAELWFNPYQTAPDPFASSRRLTQNDLKPGDLLLTTGNGFPSNVIRGATNSTYSHIALYVGGGRVIDATTNGVRDRSLADLTDSAIRVGVIRVSALTSPNSDAANHVIAQAKTLLNKPYNYTGLVTGAAFGLAQALNPYTFVGFLFSKGFKPSDLGPGYFCSEMVVKAFRSAGITQGFADTAVTPGDILRTAVASPNLFTLVGRLPPGSR